MNDSPSQGKARGVGATISGIVGIVLYLALGFLYLSSGLVVPMPWLAVLWVVWVGGWYLVVSTFASRRAWVPLVAVAALAFWWAYLSIGEALFDWTA